MAIGSPRETMFFIKGLCGYCLTTYSPDLLVFYKHMTTNKIIDEMEKELMAQMVEGDMDYKGVSILIHSYTRKLIKSVAEEIIGDDEDEALDDYELRERESKNQLRAEQRLKVKEIINSLEK